MGDENKELQKKKSEQVIKTEQSKYEQRQMLGWDTVEQFDMTTGIVATKEGLKYSNLGDMTLSSLRDELYFDTYSKSETFNEMFDSLNKLINLSVTKGKIVDENGQVTDMTADFFETYFNAKQAVSHYMDTHDGFKFMGNSKRRFQIASRVRTLLNAMGERIIEAKMQLPAEKQQEIEGAQMGLDSEEIRVAKDAKKIDSLAGEMKAVLENMDQGPVMDEKSAQKAKKEWLEGGYTEDLKKLLAGKKASKEEKNSFIAYLQNDNNRKMANKMAVGLLVDAGRKELLNMPVLKNKLTGYIYENLKEEFKTLQPREFALKVKDTIKQYLKENKKDLDKYKKRKTALKKHPVLGSSMTGDALFENPKIQELIMTDSDEQFTDKVEAIKTKVEESDAAVDEILKAKGYSEIAFDAIKTKLHGNMGALRLFGTSEQIIDQANIFCDMLRYIAPEEYEQERMLDKAMKSMKLEGVRKDGFVKFVLKQQTEKDVLRDTAWWKKQGEEYAKRVKKNTKSYLKRIEKEGVMLSQERWDLLEQMNLSSGEWENADFISAVENIIKEKNVQGEKSYSRREYISKRDFDDAEKMPALIQRRKKEEAAVKKLGNTMDSKFLLALSGDGSDPDELYIKIDDMLRGNRTKRKLAQKADEDMVAQRTAHIKRMLQKAGVPRKEWGGYVDKFRWMISGMREVGDELSSDKRAENMRINLETFGVKSWEEALVRLESYGGDLTKTLSHKDISATKELYEKRKDLLKEFEDGKYALLAERLAGIPEFYQAMMDKDEKVFKDYLKNVMAPKLKDFMDGAAEAQKGRKQQVIGAVVQQYAYSYLKDIYTGVIKGDAKFYQGRLEDYTKKVFAARSGDGDSVAGNIRAAVNEARKKYQGWGLSKFDVETATASFEYSLKYSVNSMDEFAVFMDKKKLKILANDLFEKLKKENEEIQKDAAVKRNELIGNMKRKADLESASYDPDKELRETIQKVREKGRKSRQKYLGIDNVRLDKTRLAGSLVRVAENGRETVTLTHGTVNTMRAELDKYIGSIRIPQVLKDALIEEGASSRFIERRRGIYKNSELLYRHAAAMEKLYSMLRSESPDDASMSDEEAQMYIVSLYGDISSRKLFNEQGALDVAALRKGESYRVFRDNYAKLKALEQKDYDELYIKNEQTELARNLRTMLITGVGFIDENGKSVQFNRLKADKKLEYQKKLGEMITRNTAFMDASQRLSELIRAHVTVIYENDRMPVEFLDRQVNALKEYFMSDLVRELKEGKEISEETWNNRIFEFIKDKKNRDNLEGAGNSNKEYEKLAQERSDTRLGEKDIEDVIRSSTIFFKGKENKYEKLDIEQRKLFAIALMMMDKGAIGMGTAGTSALLAPQKVKKEQAEEMARKIDAYVKGGTIDVKIDYKEAFFKLVNFGDAGVLGLSDSYVMSDTAYEKAMLFVKGITEKRQAYGEKDVKRISDGYSSIYAAYANHDKKQQNEVDKLQGVSLTVQDVRDRLLQYAENDKVSIQTLAVEGTIGAVGVAVAAAGMIQNAQADAQAAKQSEETGKTVKVSSQRKGKDAAVTIGGALPGLSLVSFEKDLSLNIDLAGIQKRLKALDDTQLKMFLRILQERSVIDVTTGEGKDKNKHADQDKRDGLTDALSGGQEVRSEVLDGFDSDESCHQAMATALSFQLKDHINFKDKPLTKEYFEKESFERTTLVDWKLIRNALDMLDEIEAKRNEIYAMRNAKKFIRSSGNKKAIEAHKQLEKDYKNKKEQFSENRFDMMISSRVDSEGDESVKNAYAGFKKLSENEKKLFYKVLGRRDLLDISKKNYVSNFFGLDERGYLNEADRNKLIDQYILANLNDNIGVQIDETSVYEAMENLLSTQLSDRVDFRKEKDLESIFSYERGLLFSRNTAIDWKLFKRALNFVTRATKELEKTEGNAMIYRGAGDLEASGPMKMDYSFLRKNFHRTGNRWTRYIGRKLAKDIKNELGVDKYLDMIDSNVGTTDNVTGNLGLKKDGLLRKAGAKIKNLTAEAKKISKAIDKNPAQMEISAIELKEKEKTAEEKAKDKEKEAKRREDLLFYQHMKEGIDNIISMKNSAQEAATEMADFLKKNLVAKFVNEKKLYSAGKKEAVADKNNIVEKMTQGVTKDSAYGDVRDYKAKVESYQKKVKGYYNIATSVPGMAQLTELAQYGANLLVYRFINNRLVGAEIKEDGDELKQLQSAADKYFKKTFDDIVISVVGKENAGKLINAENSVYNIKDTVAKTAKSIMGGIKYAKKCVSHVRNIAACLENKTILSRSEAEAGEKKAQDRKKIENAKQNRLDAHGAELMEKQHKANIAEVGLGKEVSNTIQNLNIAEDVMNLVFETTNYAGLKLNVTQEAIQKAVKDGIEFAMYAIRVVKDRDTLTDYFLKTDAGKEELKKIRNGFAKAMQYDKVDKIDKAMESYKMNITDKNTMGLVDIIADANGYEHTSELMEDTAMQMAQSIVFSASNYNPLMETKIMATSVMVVMGLGSEVGNTTPDAVEKLFKSFKMPS